MSQDLSRRKLAGVLAGAVAANTVAAQAPSVPPADADLEVARSRQRSSARAVAQVSLPITVEPAFQFKA